MHHVRNGDAGGRGARPEVGGPGGAGFVAVFAGAVGLGVVPRVVVFARVDVLGLLAVLVVVGADVIAPVDAVGDGA